MRRKDIEEVSSMNTDAEDKTGKVKLEVWTPDRQPRHHYWAL